MYINEADDIKRWASIYADTFVCESEEAGTEKIEEAALTYDAKYLAAVKKELKDLEKTNKFAYDMAVKYVTMNTGKPAANPPEVFAQKRRELAASQDAAKKAPEVSREERMAQVAAKQKADFDAIQKAEFERKNPRNIASVWVKSVNIVPSDESKSNAVVEITYKDGKKTEDKIDIGTTGTAGGFENADRLYKQVKRNFAASGKRATDLDIRLAIIRIGFSDPQIKWFYGKDRAADSAWAFSKEAKKLDSDPVVKKERKAKEAARSAIYKSGNTTIYRTESEDQDTEVNESGFGSKVFEIDCEDRDGNDIGTLKIDCSGLKANIDFKDLAGAFYSKTWTDEYLDSDAGFCKKSVEGNLADVNFVGV